MFEYLKSKGKIIIYAFLIILCPLFSCSKDKIDNNELTLNSNIKHKILYVDSYNVDLPWVQGITKGILTTLNVNQDSLDNYSSNTIDLKIIHMDTKLNQSEKFIKNSVMKVKNIIEKWKPDIVITSDDNAAKYLIVPYYKNSSIPFVFCGINWDVSEYGLPTKNITGMIEVQLIPQIVAQLKSYFDGKTVGFLKGDTFSSRKEAENFEKILGFPLIKTFSESYTDWEKSFIEIQKDVDILLLGNLGGINDWDRDEEKLKDFIIKNTVIPTGSWDESFPETALITLATIPEEQGEWAAKTALEILKGTLPKDIEVVKNKRAKAFLNMPIAKKLGIKFSQELIDNSNIVGVAKKKVLFVDSYHKGFGWSDGIINGLLKSLSIESNSIEGFNNLRSKVKLEVFRMNSKVNKSESEIRAAALEAKELIDRWKPDIVITSDDNAVKYLLVPYFIDSEIPFIFCGVNWDASEYNLSSENSTGMLEVSLILEMINDIKIYSRGNRIGLLASDMLSQRKAVDIIKNTLSVNFKEELYVSSFEDWKRSFKELQNKVDILLIKSYAGIEDFNLEEAIKFVNRETIIPSIATQKDFSSLALMCYSKIPEEQGEWAGKTALRILSGELTKDIPIVTNKLYEKIIDIELKKKLGLDLSKEEIKK